MPDAYDPGVPLDHNRQHGASIQLHSNRCAPMTLLDLETTIAGLIALGLGDEHTGIHAIARPLRRGGERCGAAAWKTPPYFPSQKPAAAGGGV